MIHELVDEQRRYLNSYFDRFDREKAKEILAVLQECRGTLVLSGVGKSGHIAQKIAATFLSTGTKALFLDPTHAVHGDLGSVSDSDVFIGFSKSGESQELLELLPFIKKRGAKTIAVVSSERSRLSKACDLSILLPVERELCPFDLAPTTSTTVQLLFGDCMAIGLMRSKQVTLSDYALNHPGGFIGRRIALKVQDLMLRGNDLPLCRPQDTLMEVLHQLSAKRCGCLLVVDENNQLMGIFTDGDLRRSLQARGPTALQASIEALMTKSPRTISPDRLAWEAMRQMEEDPARMIYILPVLDEGCVVGLLRMHDILQAGL